jgi:hypothetical protein
MTAKSRNLLCYDILIGRKKFESIAPFSVFRISEPKWFPFFFLRKHLAFFCFETSKRRRDARRNDIK